jgi:hypothetical protein
MGKTKEKNHKVGEDLRGELRTARKQIKSLRRELDNALNKLYEAEHGRVEQSSQVKSKPNGGALNASKASLDDCPKCGSGLRFLELVNKQYKICSNNKCGFREVIRK